MNLSQLDFRWFILFLFLQELYPPSQLHRDCDKLASWKAQATPKLLQVITMSFFFFLSQIFLTFLSHLAPAVFFQVSFSFPSCTIVDRIIVVLLYLSQWNCHIFSFHIVGLHLPRQNLQVDKVVRAVTTTLHHLYASCWLKYCVSYRCQNAQ